MTCRFHSFITSFSPSLTSVNSSSCCKQKINKFTNYDAVIWTHCYPSWWNTLYHSVTCVMFPTFAVMSANTCRIQQFILGMFCWNQQRWRLQQVMLAGSGDQCWSDKNVVHGCKSKMKKCYELAVVVALSTFKLFMGSRADPNALTLCCHGNPTPKPVFKSFISMFCPPQKHSHTTTFILLSTYKSRIVSWPQSTFL